MVPVGRATRTAFFAPPFDSLWLARLATGMPSTSTNL